MTHLSKLLTKPVELLAILISHKIFCPIKSLHWKFMWDLKLEIKYKNSVHKKIVLPPSLFHTLE